MYTKEELLERIKSIYGDKYDYDFSTYTKMIDPMRIICPIHGEFWQSLHQHINKKQGCPKCGLQIRANKRKDTTESFIEKAKHVHGDRYDYSKVNYVDSHTKVCIICPEHGEFWQQPNCHLNGRGCKKCSIKTDVIRKSRKKLNKLDFESYYKEKFGNKFEYDLSNYKNTNSIIRIRCNKHGWFTQCANTHMKSKTGCPKCSYEKDVARKYSTTTDFIRKATEIHGNKYDYSRTQYIDSETKVCITCPEHGNFWQSPANHLTGCGCRKCGELFYSTSKQESELYEFIKDCVTCNVIRNDKSILNGKELDIYIPDKKIAFEYDGLYWHSELKKPDVNYHIDKTEKCTEQGIRLIHIFEDEWAEKKDICKSRIKTILGCVETKIYARKCTISEISSKEKTEFLNRNHIQGDSKSAVNIGLYHNNKLVSVMTFSKPRRNLGNKNRKDGQYELARFCNSLNTTVVGGASKLLDYFIKKYSPKEIISYADRRWSDGGLYDKLGFSLDHMSKPSYFYIIGDKRKNRFEYRKDILVSKYGCGKDTTEHEFCKSNGWYRIYDCGTLVYKLEL